MTLKWISDAYTGAPAFEVKFDRVVFDRPTYTWTVRLDNGGPMDGDERVTFTASDLSLGARQEPNDVEALRAFASFLNAWCEACDAAESDGNWERENVDLFPRAMWDAISGWSEYALECACDIEERD